MKAEMRIENPDELLMTLSITMPLKKWREIRDQIDNKYPGFELRSVITNAIIKATTHLFSDGDAH